MQRDLLGRPDRPPRVQRASRLLDVVAASAGRRRRRPCGSIPSRPLLLTEREQAAAREVEHRRRQRATRRAAVHDHRAGRGGQVGRWGGHEDRRVVEVDRVLAEPAPVEERPADEPEQRDRRADQPEDRVELARLLQGRGVLRGRRRVDLLERDLERAVEVAVYAGTAACRSRRSPGARSLLRNAASKPGAGVQLHLAVLARRIDVEEDDQAVVEPGPPDVPLVDEGARPRLGLGGARCRSSR